MDHDQYPHLISIIFIVVFLLMSFFMSLIKLEIIMVFFMYRTISALIIQSIQ